MTHTEEPATTGPKPKKSVALSGVVAGNTALCTVGRTGNDLHYRGYDILEIADTLRIRGDRAPADPRQAAQRAPSWPPTRQAHGAARPARRRRACSSICRPRHIRWTCCAPAFPRSAALLPEKARSSGRGRARHRRPSARPRSARCWLLVSLQPRGTAHRGRNRRRFDRRRISCTCCTAAAARPWVRAMHTSLILYAEHDSMPRPSPRA